MPSVNRDNLTVRSSKILKSSISLVRPLTPTADKWLPQGQKPTLTVARYGPHPGSIRLLRGSGMCFGRRTKHVPRPQDGGFRFRAVNSCRRPAPLSVPTRLQRGIPGADQAGLPSFPHERRKAPRRVPLWRSPLCTIPPQERTTRGTPGPSPRRRTPAVSLGLGLKGCRIALSPCYHIQLSDKVGEAGASVKTTPRTRADRWLLAQSSRLSSSQ
jgi:hypothetical protein